MHGVCLGAKVSCWIHCFFWSWTFPARSLHHPPYVINGGNGASVAGGLSQTTPSPVCVRVRSEVQLSKPGWHYFYRDTWKRHQGRQEGEEDGCLWDCLSFSIPLLSLILALSPWRALKHLECAVSKCLSSSSLDPQNGMLSSVFALF